MAPASPVTTLSSAITLPDVRRTEQVALLSGAITLPAVRRIEAEIGAGATTLVVDSGGGDEDAALELAAEIQRRKLTVVAVRTCFSACASYVLAASPAREVRGVTLIGFHHTSTALLLTAEARSSTPAPLLAQLRRRAAEERQLYQAAGLDLRLLTDPLYDLRPVCAWSSMETVLVGPSDWIPDQALLARYHYVIAGGAPASVSSFIQRYGAEVVTKPGDFRERDGQSFIQPESVQVRAVFEHLPDCPPQLQGLNPPGAEVDPAPGGGP